LLGDIGLRPFEVRQLILASLLELLAEFLENVLSHLVVLILEVVSAVLCEFLQHGIEVFEKLDSKLNEPISFDGDLVIEVWLHSPRKLPKVEYLRVSLNSE
jgi:hypothetical protein